jgi:hypothetical protein
MNLGEIAAAIEAKPNSSDLSVRVVAIDGHGGAGKSTLAEKLAKRLGALILHTDDFASWDEPLDWWVKLEAAVFEPIARGAATLTYGRSRWSDEHQPTAVDVQVVTPVVILEGVSSARREFRRYLTFAIWVDTPIEVCLQRGLERDGGEALPLWERWVAAEDAYIARDDPAGYADVAVSGVARS